MVEKSSKLPSTPSSHDFGVSETQDPLAPELAEAAAETAQCLGTDAFLGKDDGGCGWGMVGVGRNPPKKWGYFWANYNDLSWGHRKNMLLRTVPLAWRQISFLWLAFEAAMLNAFQEVWGTTHCYCKDGLIVWWSWIGSFLGSGCVLVRFAFTWINMGSDFICWTTCGFCNAIELLSKNTRQIHIQSSRTCPWRDASTISERCCKSRLACSPAVYSAAWRRKHCAVLEHPAVAGVRHGRVPPSRWRFRGMDVLRKHPNVQLHHLPQGFCGGLSPKPTTPSLRGFVQITIDAGRTCGTLPLHSEQNRLHSADFEEDTFQNRAIKLGTKCPVKRCFFFCWLPFFERKNSEVPWDWYIIYHVTYIYHQESTKFM